MDRRKFLQLLGIGGAVAVTPAVVAGVDPLKGPAGDLEKLFTAEQLYEFGNQTLIAYCEKYAEHDARSDCYLIDGVSGQLEKQSFHGTPIVWDDDDYDPNRVYIARHRSNG